MIQSNKFMKYLAGVLCLALVVNVLSCKRVAHAPRPERSEFASRVAGTLPPKWTIEENSGEVIIRRQDPVRVFNCVCLDLSLTVDQERLKEFVERDGLTADFRIRLRRSPKLELSEYARYKELNGQIAITKDTSISPRDFYEQDAMLSFDPRYHELPSYYDATSSIYVETTAHPYDCMYPPEVARECDEVLLSLDSLFTRYETKPFRSLVYGGVVLSR